MSCSDCNCLGVMSPTRASLSHLSPCSLHDAQVTWGNQKLLTGYRPYLDTQVLSNLGSLTLESLSGRVWIFTAWGGTREDKKGDHAIAHMAWKSTLSLGIAPRPERLGWDKSDASAPWRGPHVHLDQPFPVLHWLPMSPRRTQMPCAYRTPEVDEWPGTLQGHRFSVGTRLLCSHSPQVPQSSLLASQPASRYLLLQCGWLTGWWSGSSLRCWSLSSCSEPRCCSRGSQT